MGAGSPRRCGDPEPAVHSGKLLLVLRSYWEYLLFFFFLFCFFRSRHFISLCQGPDVYVTGACVSESCGCWLVLVPPLRTLDTPLDLRPPPPPRCCFASNLLSIVPAASLGHEPNVTTELGTGPSCILSTKATRHSWGRVL